MNDPMLAGGPAKPASDAKPRLSVCIDALYANLPLPHRPQPRPGNRWNPSLRQSAPPSRRPGG